MIEQTTRRFMSVPKMTGKVCEKCLKKFRVAEIQTHCHRCGNYLTEYDLRSHATYGITDGWQEPEPKERMFI